MTRLHAVVVSLALAALIALSGCTYTKVSSLDNQMEFNFKVDSLGERKNYTAVVFPFTDGREREYRKSRWEIVPVIGLFTQFLSSRHTYPEVTFNHYPSKFSDISGGAIEYIKGDFAQTIPRMLGGGLREAGVFKEVKFAQDLDENFDMREYDYVIRGRVISTELRIRNMTYGLSIFDLIELDWVLKLLGAPDSSLAADVAYQMQIVERQTGKSVWSGKIEHKKQTWLVGYYYGRRLEGKSPNVGIFTRSFEKEMSEVVNRVKAEIQY